MTSCTSLAVTQQHERRSRRCGDRPLAVALPFPLVDASPMRAMVPARSAVNERSPGVATASRTVNTRPWPIAASTAAASAGPRRPAAGRARRDSRTSETRLRIPATARETMTRSGSVRCRKPSLACASEPANTGSMRVCPRASQRSNSSSGRSSSVASDSGARSRIRQQRARQRRAAARRATRCRRSAIRGRRPARPSRSSAAPACGEPGMRGDAEAAEPLHVFDHVARSPPSGYGVGGSPSATKCPPSVLISTRVDAPARRRDTRGASGDARAVAVVGEDDELQPGPRRRGGDLVDACRCRRSVGVHVIRAAHRSRARRGRRRCRWRAAAASSDDQRAADHGSTTARRRLQRQRSITLRGWNRS